MADLSNTRDRCEKTVEGIGWWAAAYRKYCLRKGRPDPGNLCGRCSAINDIEMRKGE